MWPAPNLKMSSRLGRSSPLPLIANIVSGPEGKMQTDERLKMAGGANVLLPGDPSACEIMTGINKAGCCNVKQAVAT